ncbi:MAG TPA: serine hydrolase domain-containing protein [Chloroflexaceae bacterium]|nr:serine hydrolase domain-containing protein [Chloroflexaceae bacterium]
MATTRRRALLALLLALLLTLAPAGAPPAAAQPAFPPELAAALDAALHAARRDARAPGALLYVSAPGLGAFSGASGLADVAAGAPLVPDARVRLASLTKPFVAAVAMQLVQEGWLRLDHSVEHWLPGLVPGGAQITVAQLMRHTSGLPDYLSDGIVGRARRAPERVWAPRELVAEALGKPRRFAPGAPGRWAYANTNYILLGMIVERVTGNPLERELGQRIFAPLGLRGAALAPPTADPGDLVRGYVGGRDYTALNMSVAWAAGGMTASVGDVGAFAEALFGGRLLRPEPLAAMLACEGTGAAWGIADMAYGLGLMRRALPAAGLAPEARLALGHTGALGGYRTAMWHLPQSGVTIVVALTRYEADPTPLVTRALEALAAHGVVG